MSSERQHIPQQFQPAYSQEVLSLSQPSTQLETYQNSITIQSAYLPAELLNQSLEISDSEDLHNSSISGSDKEDYFPNNFLRSKQERASTAPPRTLTDIEEFRRSADFVLLEQAVYQSSQLIQRSDQKYDLDSAEGQKACKKLLQQLERMSENFKVQIQSRSYRTDFSRAYRVLYKEGQICYLTEILDSAQEGFPYL